jgi:hypothetical protein
MSAKIRAQIVIIFHVRKISILITQARVDEYLDFGSVHLQNKFLQIYLRCEIESSKYSSVATQILPNIGFWTEKTLSRTAVLFIRHRIPISYARLFIRRSITHAYIQHSFYFIYLFFLFKNILQR